MLNRYFDWIEKRPELTFIGKVLATAVFVYSVRHFFYAHWIFLLFVLGFLPFVMLKLMAIKDDKGVVDVLRENLTFISVPYTEKERNAYEPPIVTYMLILVNVSVFYCVEPFITRDIARQIVSVPIEPAWYNVLPSMLISMFLHGSPGHLWGNMLFLWAFGSTVERRIGALHFIVFYLCAGFFGDILSIAVHAVSGSILPRAIGASGAISGLLGLYAVRCYFKTMILPFPLFGLFSYLTPVSVFIKVRINALFLIALYFMRDMHGSFRDLFGVGFSRIAYWNHLGGFLSAVVIGFLFLYHKDARLEKESEFAYDSFESSVMGTDEGESALKRHLARNPDDEQGWLLLARMHSRYRQDDDGRSAYESAIRASLKKNATEALNIFREYFDLYLRPLDAGLQYRMAALASRSGDLHFATRCLEPIIASSDTPLQLRQNSIRHYATLCKRLGFAEAADHYTEK